MAKKAGKRHTKGMLTSMVKYPKNSPHKKKGSIVRGIAFWTGTIVVGAGLIALLAALLATLFHPEMGKRDGEGDFAVERVTENPPGYPPADRVVAEALVEIERTKVRIPLEAGKRAGVEAGSILHIRYEHLPRMNIVRVRDWRLEKGPTTGPPTEGGPAVPAL